MTSTKTKFEHLTDVDSVCRALGGVRSVMALTEAKSPQTVNNWRALGRFASHTYLILTKALEQKGYVAPPGLWGIADPAARSERAESPVAGG